MTRNRSGFALLEMMIALVFFTVAIVSVIGAMNSGLFASGDVDNMRLASLIAQAKLEEMGNTPFASIVSSGPAADPVFPHLTVRVNVTGTDPKTIGVVISWNVAGSPVSMTVTTLKTQI